MTTPQRLEFVARHFNDLQTIRLAPIPFAMLLAPAWHLLPHLSRGGAWAGLLLFLVTVGGFYWWSTIAIRRRYGTVKQSTKEASRMRGHPVIILLSLAVVVVLVSSQAHHTPWADNYITLMVLSTMLITILDRTNLASRRMVWALGLVILFGAGPFLLDVDGGAAIFSLAGAVWLSLSTFDFLLLRRILAKSSAPPAAITNPVMHHG